MRQSRNVERSRDVELLLAELAPLAPYHVAAMCGVALLDASLYLHWWIAGFAGTLLLLLILPVSGAVLRRRVSASRLEELHYRAAAGAIHWRLLIPHEPGPGWLLWRVVLAITVVAWPVGAMITLMS